MFKRLSREKNIPCWFRYVAERAPACDWHHAGAGITMLITSNSRVVLLFVTGILMDWMFHSKNKEKGKMDVLVNISLIVSCVCFFFVRFCSFLFLFFICFSLCPNHGQRLVDNKATQVKYPNYRLLLLCNILFLQPKQHWPCRAVSPVLWSDWTVEHTVSSGYTRY